MKNSDKRECIKQGIECLKQCNQDAENQEALDDIVLDSDSNQVRTFVITQRVL